MHGLGKIPDKDGRAWIKRVFLEQDRQVAGLGYEYCCTPLPCISRTTLATHARTHAPGAGAGAVERAPARQRFQNHKFDMTGRVTLIQGTRAFVLGINL